MKGQLCGSKVLAEFATTIKTSPQIVEQPIISLTSTKLHSLDCRKRAPVLKPVSDQILDLAHQSFPIGFFTVPVRAQLARDRETDDLQLWRMLL